MMFGIGGSLNKVNKNGTLYSNLQYVLCGSAYFTSLYQRYNYIFILATNKCKDLRSPSSSLLKHEIKP